MIFFVAAKINEIFKKGIHYPWIAPQNCPNCSHYKVWGHGFRMAYFDGFIYPLFLKRYRCPSCKCVLCCRPRDYFKGFQARIETIRSSISHRINTGKWMSGFSRSRQWQWFSALKKQAAAFMGNLRETALLNFFDSFVYQSKNPVTRRI